jgi:hypothetical protein
MQTPLLVKMRKYVHIFLGNVQLKIRIINSTKSSYTFESGLVLVLSLVILVLFSSSKLHL